MSRQWFSAVGYLSIFLMPALFLIGAIADSHGWRSVSSSSCSRWRASHSAHCLLPVRLNGTKPWPRSLTACRWPTRPRCPFVCWPG